MLKIGIQHELRFIRLGNDELQVLARDLYEDKCIELGQQPNPAAFNEESTYWPEVQITNMTGDGKGNVQWTEESDGKNLSLTFYQSCSKETASITQPLEYTGPMTEIGVALWVEHWLLVMLELYVIQQLYAKIDEVGNEAKTVRAEISAQLKAEQDKYDAR